MPFARRSFGANTKEDRALPKHLKTGREILLGGFRNTTTPPRPGERGTQLGRWQPAWDR